MIQHEATASQYTALEKAAEHWGRVWRNRLTIAWKLERTRQRSPLIKLNFNSYEIVLEQTGSIASSLKAD